MSEKQYCGECNDHPDGFKWRVFGSDGTLHGTYGDPAKANQVTERLLAARVTTPSPAPADREAQLAEYYGDDLEWNAGPIAEHIRSTPGITISEEAALRIGMHLLLKGWHVEPAQ